MQEGKHETTKLPVDAATDPVGAAHSRNGSELPLQVARRLALHRAAPLPPPRPLPPDCSPLPPHRHLHHESRGQRAFRAVLRAHRAGLHLALPARALVLLDLPLLRAAEDGELSGEAGLLVAAAEQGGGAAVGDPAAHDREDAAFQLHGPRQHFLREALRHARAAQAAREEQAQRQAARVPDQAEREVPQPQVRVPRRHRLPHHARLQHRRQRSHRPVLHLQHQGARALQTGHRDHQPRRRPPHPPGPAAGVRRAGGGALRGGEFHPPADLLREGVAQRAGGTEARVEVGAGGEPPVAVLHGEERGRPAAGVHGDAADLALQRHLHEGEHQDLDPSLRHHPLLRRLRPHRVHRRYAHHQLPQIGLPRAQSQEHLPPDLRAQLGGLPDQLHPESGRLLADPILLRHQGPSQQQHPGRRLRAHHPHRLQLHALLLAGEHELRAGAVQADRGLRGAHGGDGLRHLPALQAALLPGREVSAQVQEGDLGAGDDDD